MSWRLLLRHIPYKHKRPTIYNPNGVNCILFIIVPFCILCTNFKATLDDIHVCNDANLDCRLSSRRQITKHAHFLSSSPSSRRLRQNLLFHDFLCFDVNFVQNDLFSFNHMPQVGCKTYLKEILLQRKKHTLQFNFYVLRILIP